MITGAAGGLGAALADALAPTHTLLLAGRPSARLDAVAERLGATTWPIDLADPDTIAASSSRSSSSTCWSTTPGWPTPDGSPSRSVDEWRATMTVNVVGAVALTLELLPALRSAARPRRVHQLGVPGINASPGLASYSASKFALRAFADSLRADEPALRVTTVYPGRIDYRMQRDLVAYEGREYRPEQFLKPQTVAQFVAQAVNAPPDADVHEVVVRPPGDAIVR